MKKHIRKPYAYRKGTGEFLTIQHANQHNLKNIDVSFPIGCLISVTGVSGCGKSTLVFDVLAKGNTEGNENVVHGLSYFDHVIQVEQAPLTRMKRSNVATFIQLYGEIRKIFANIKQSKEQGFTYKDFSFNNKGGRCENCEGLGYVNSNMLFFEDIELPCPICHGAQFHEDILSVQYQGYSIHEVLKLSVEKASEVFKEHKKLLHVLILLQDVGLGYLQLGQTLTTLSAGEGQRLKLAKELLTYKGKHNLYLIDEPTTGLHPLDIEHFLVLLQRMVDIGNTIVVIEHNQQVIRACDWVIDLGLEGGVHGGNIIAQGTPESIQNNIKSITGKYLKSC